MLTMKIDEPKGYLPEDIYNLAIMNVLVTVEEDCTILEESVVNRGKKKKKNCLKISFPEKKESHFKDEGFIKLIVKEQSSSK